MTNMFFTNNGFMKLETFCNLSIATIGASIIGVPFASMLILPSTCMTLFAAGYNCCQHCFFKANDPLLLDVRHNLAASEINISRADEGDIIRFIGQISRLMTTNGTLFGYGKTASTMSQVGAFAQRVCNCPFHR